MAGWRERAIALALAATAPLAGEALAGTTGGIYDFSRTLAEPHPFAGPATTPAVPPSGVVPRAPLRGSPAPGYPSLSAPAPVPPRPAAQGQPALAPVAPAPPTYGYTPPPVPRAGQPAQVLRERDQRFRAPDSEDTLLGGGFFRRLYLAAAGGIALLEDYDDQVGGIAFQNEFDSGFLASLALGRSFGQDLRGELAVDLRQNAIEGIRFGGRLFPGDGDVNSYAIMLNGYYDLRWLGRFVPFVGVGFGAAFISGDEVQFAGRRAPAKDGTEFAYQGIVGLAYEFSSFALTLDYRYFATGDDDIAYQNATAGLRYAF